MATIRQWWDKAWASHNRIKDLLSIVSGKPGNDPPKDSGRMAKASGKMTGTYRQPSPDGKDFTRKQKIGLVLGPLLFLLILFFFDAEGLPLEARGVLAATAWIATWWITEAIPIPVTSLLPIILMPLVTTIEVGEVTPNYGDNIVFLFLGGFIIALALERWNLHKRIALAIINAVGTSTKRLMLGFMLATAFLSMWISNTATAMMMVPIGTAIIYQLGSLIDETSVNNAKQEEERFSKGLMIAIAFAASIGGLGTIIGTPPNTILAGQLDEIFGIDLAFADWMLFGVPLSVTLLLVAWFYLVTFAFPMKMKEIPGGKKVVQEERSALGAMTADEKAVMTVFTLTALAWISRTYVLQEYVHEGIDDTMIAITGAFVLFLIPSFQYQGVKLMNWHTAKDVPWGILILFGGGLAIASAFGDTGLDVWIGEQLGVLVGVELILIVLAVAVLVLFLTEITSNTASATMLMPIMASLAYAIDVHPFAMMVPAAVAASCAFMLPVATPPNAVVFGSGYLKMMDMVKAGFWMNLIAIVALTVFVMLLLPLVFGIDISTFP
ncbi:SLC13 family permease [Salisediminibacterium halotolerans]|uniref:SLC13 family permease n=1 Tax=Salisediminibacterium halotolerans TaxID=517425 RepID=UPI000EB1939D|nr:DASS family sodium-coupled anion symporter [Salisediminibacterium halotolerans]RLJ73164.1 sodium-dependent dicarboxylate transporter 2/3/5 [Actinophytocola xinjiangensis]RPE86586.1 sodium-dependent dicarboxylate transporter 2/3/5 [Salisediminibacterium halotolerans]TWG33961.1 sodium-dependent dicarboxylate transporter 2/3/5 [Salisediminibacterium halotolerans]GEL06631.1 sodium-dependent dicarboxylate transporter SdcS [Salisediminibacterium halotolerans]